MATNELNILTLNTQGILNQNIRRKLFAWLVDIKVDIILLQETHLTSKNEHYFNSGWKGGYIHSLTDSAHSRGTSILFRPGLELDIINHHCSDDGRRVLANIKYKDEIVTIVSAYAPNSENERKHFFKRLKTWVNQTALNADNIIIGGDMNCPLNANDRNTGTHLNDKSRSILKSVLNDLKLKDTWCNFHPNHSGFTRCSKTVSSRIDYIFTTENLVFPIQSCSIINPVTSDHFALLLSCKTFMKHKGPGYWKLNAQLIENNDYCNGVKQKIKETKETYGNTLPHQVFWEILKINIKEYTINFSVQLAHTNKKELEEKQDELNEITNKLNQLHGNPNDQTGENLLTRQAELKSYMDNFYDKKAKGIQIRARANWVQKGEKSTRYFLGLENKRQSSNVIRGLKNKEGNLLESDQDILNEMTEYYKNLYSEKPITDESIHDYLQNAHVPNILNETDSKFCDSNIKLSELRNAVQSLKLNKSPGLDGLTAEFYQKFWSQLEQYYYLMILESYENRMLPESVRKAVLAILYKKGDRTNLKNYRPLSLMNIDYKIIATVLAKRMQLIIKKVINQDQTAYIKGRYIGTNTRLINDVFEWCEDNNKPGALIFLDFQKAFDSINHKFMYAVLSKFGFGPVFNNWVHTLYNNANLCVKNNGWVSSKINMKQGIRQGCPVSALLFILTVEILASQIRSNENIKGIKVTDRQTQNVISQFADDATLLLSDIQSIPHAIDTINSFGKVSGLMLNMDKCVGIWLGPYKTNNAEMYGIKFTQDAVKCLGIWMGHNKEQCYQFNWQNKLNKIKQTLESWEKRKLTLIGKILIIKIMAVSNLTYSFTNLVTPENIIKDLNKILYGFIWNTRDRIKRNVLINDIEKGGLGMLDLESHICALKASWISRLIQALTGNANWPSILSASLKMKGMDIIFLLQCNVKNKEILMQNNIVPEFYAEVITSFNKCKSIKNMQLMSNFEFQTQTLCLNSNFCLNRKPIYIPNLLKSGLKYVNDVLDQNGNILSPESFRAKLKSSANWLIEFNIITKILKKQVTSREMSKITNQIHSIYLYANKKCFKIENQKSGFFYDILITKKAETPTSERYWSRRLNISTLNWQDINNVKIKLFPEKKVGEFNYKLIHNLVASGYVLSKWNPNFSGFCQNDQCSDIETTEHMLYNCHKIKPIWDLVSGILKIKIDWRCIVLGPPLMITLAQKQKMVIISMLTFTLYKYWLNNRGNFNLHALLLMIKQELAITAKVYRLVANEYINHKMLLSLYEAL